MKTPDNIQFIFACLVTHSYLIRKIMNDFNEIHRFFTLSTNDQDGLRIFLKTESKKLLTSAVMMENKRWKEVLPAMKFVTLLLPLKKLKGYWNKYLLSINPQESIPESTIKETINFLKFIINKEMQNTFLREIARYLLEKSIVSTYNYSEIKNQEHDNSFDIEKDYHLYRPVINPSYSLLNFEFPISKSISDLTYGRNINMKHPFLNGEAETIVLFKSKASNVVRTIRLNDISNDLFIKLIDTKSLSCWEKSLANLSHKKKGIYGKFINEMIKVELITIKKIDGMKYVF